jgi:hypothetical protein
MTAIDLHLSSGQARKLLKGEGILLKHTQVAEGGAKFHLPPHIIKKLHSAKRRRKGLRLRLGEEDRDVNGGSIASFFKNKVLPVYHASVAPVVRQSLKDIANAAAGAVGSSVGGPTGAMLAAQAAPYINQGVDYAGNKTGGFGLLTRHVRRHRVGRGVRLVHPTVYRPTLPGLPDFSMPDFVHSGVSQRELAPRTGGRKAVVRGGSFLPN